MIGVTGVTCVTGVTGVTSNWVLEEPSLRAGTRQLDSAHAHGPGSASGAGGKCDPSTGKHTQAPTTVERENYIY